MAKEGGGDGDDRAPDPGGGRAGFDDFSLKPPLRPLQLRTQATQHSRVIHYPLSGPYQLQHSAARHESLLMRRRLETNEGTLFALFQPEGEFRCIVLSSVSNSTVREEGERVECDFD